MLRTLLLSVLLAITLPLAAQRAIFFGQNVPPPSGGGPVYVNSAQGANTGVDTPATVTYSCTHTGDPLWAFGYYTGSGITGYAIAGMTINTASQNGNQYVFTGATCPDTSPHTYTFTFTCTVCSGNAEIYIVETTGHFDAAGPTLSSPPTTSSMDAQATATASSGMCIAFGQSHSWTPSPPAGYTLVYNDGFNNFFYNNTCYSSTGVVTFSAPIVGGASGNYETSIVLVKS